MAVALLIAACTADTDESAAPLTVVDDSPAPPQPPASSSTTSTVAPSTTSSTVAVVDDLPASTTTEAPVAAPDDDGDDPLTLEERIAAEDYEPSFEIGPPVLIDVDVARFPVDDAGLGGGQPAADPGADVGNGAADVPDPTVGLTGWAAFNASLESALLRPDNTSAAVAVMIGGDLVNAAAFGVRDPAQGDPAEPTDRYRIASISKPITAVVALELVEQGLIGLDEPIGRRIADHVGATQVSGGAEQLTLRRLLTHTSGFGKYYSTFFQRGADDCPDAARQGLARAAGSGGYTYSNMNYCLAGMLIEAVTGETLERATYRLLLTPLGLSGLRLAPTIDPGPGEAQHRTTPGRAYMETLGGAGSWIASPIDLVTIVDSLDHSTSGFKPLEPLTVLQMLTPHNGALGQRGYGLGVISYGAGRVGHTGTIEATHAMVLNRGDGVVWAVTVAGDWPGESERLEQLVNEAFAAGGFVAG